MLPDELNEKLGVSTMIFKIGIDNTGNKITLEFNKQYNINLLDGCSYSNFDNKQN